MVVFVCTIWGSPITCVCLLVFPSHSDSLCKSLNHRLHLRIHNLQMSFSESRKMTGCHNNSPNNDRQMACPVYVQPLYVTRRLRFWQPFWMTSSSPRLWHATIDSHTILEEDRHMSRLIVITVSADDLAPTGARVSAGAVMTKVAYHMY